MERKNLNKMFTADELMTHEKDLLHYAVKRTYNVDIARDFVQETYLKAIKYKHTYREGSPLGPWLQTILINTMKSYTTSLKCRPQISEVTLEDLDMYAPISTLDTYDYGYIFNDERLDRAYRDLKFAHKQIVYLTYVMDKSHVDISKRLKLSQNTCRTRLKNALDNLREMVA